MSGTSRYAAAAFHAATHIATSKSDCNSAYFTVDATSPTSKSDCNSVCLTNDATSVDDKFVVNFGEIRDALLRVLVLVKIRG